ncbi:MAG: hypothetical protein K2I16_01885 [Muribaculaceae bacterium]|nr:hypothetical protein [Muribaculaceae bacterium]
MAHDSGGMDRFLRAIGSVCGILHCLAEFIVAAPPHLLRRMRIHDDEKY